MAERKAVNKYYPPEWTPDKGGINKFRGTHALRERARKLHMGILIIRFEMPYNIWCNGCENHIGMGVRYNAEKTKVGMYYTTPIYKFRMKCHLCTNHFEIQTDPQNLDYTILNGARRQERRWDPTQNEQVVPEDKDVSKKLSTDSMFHLEHSVNDKAKKKSLIPSLTELEYYKEQWKEDYELNKMLRNKFREEKKEIKSTEEKDSKLCQKFSLNLPLMPESEEDRKLAALMKLAPIKSFEERQKLKREETLARPLFIEVETEKPAFVQTVQKSKMKKVLKPLSVDKLGIILKTTDAKVPNRNIPVTNSSSTKTSLVSCDYESDSDEDTS